MRLESTLLKSRVARRMFALFILSAIIPVLITGLISFSQVNTLMVSQVQAQLRQASKGYGLSIFNRLELAGDRLREIASLEEGGKIVTGAHADKRFSALALVYPSKGRLEPLTGTMEHFASMQDMVRKALESGQTVVAHSAMPESQARVFVGQRFVSHESAPAVLIGELDPNYLWSSETLSLDRDYCVMTSKMQPLFCTVPLPAAAAETLRTRRARSSSGTLEWRHEGERYLTGYWELFLKVRFHAPEWVMVTSQNEALAFATVTIFKRIYPPVIVLSILLVTLLSVNQIRRTLIPLEKLIAGTRRLARRDFDARVSVSSHDEFAELAASMNDMADRLGRQFNALAILAEMDRQILSKLETERIVYSLLKRIDKIVPCQAVCITLLDRGNPTMAVNHVMDNAAKDAHRLERVKIGGEEMQEAVTNPEGLWLLAPVEARGYIHSIAKSARMSFLVFAIRYEERAYGLFSLAYPDRLIPSPEDRSQLRDLADRIAVALSAVEREEKLFQQAHYDVLTGLPNRQLFHDRLDQHLAHVDREDYVVALLFIDLDRFKNVNDASGHSTGDQLLKVAATRLQTCIRNTDTVARLMGDEFAIILSGIDTPWTAGAIADKVIAQLSQPFSIEQQEHHLGASVGIAIYPGDGTTAEVLLRNADTAMYKAKDSGRGVKRFFKQEMNIEITERTVLENDLRRALSRDELFLVYQPKVELCTDHVVGAEALIRWQHPQRGLVTPHSFISIAEDSGLIDAIGEWVLRVACAQYMAWQAQGTPIKHIAVNLSTRQLRRNGFIDAVRALLAETGMPPECLELEITESLMVGDLPQATGILNDLHDMGIRIAIDDFGTGYSSMSYMQQLPFDTLKIDRSFISPITAEKDTQVIARTIIVMAHTLNKTVVAEGLETEAHLAFLREQRCDVGQGYYFSRPLPADRFVEFTYGRQMTGEKGIG